MYQLLQDLTVNKYDLLSEVFLSLVMANKCWWSIRPLSIQDGLIKLNQVPCFNVGGVTMAETVISAFEEFLKEKVNLDPEDTK